MLQSPAARIDSKAQDHMEPSVKRKREEPLLGDKPPDGSISFNSDTVVFKQHIQRPPSGRELHVYTSTAAVCIAGLLQCDDMQIQQCQSAHRQDVITVTVPLSIVMKLPVLKDLWEVTVPLQELKSVSPGKGSAGSTLKDKLQTVPFTPPVSIWALVSLLLVLEDKIDLWNLFGTDTDPRLAAHTLRVSSSLHCP
jgi:hypothetical protein